MSRAKADMAGTRAYNDLASAAAFLSTLHHFSIKTENYGENSARARRFSCTIRHDGMRVYATGPDPLCAANVAIGRFFARRKPKLKVV